MDADKALLRKLTGCQTTGERVDLLIGELDRLGYSETWSYLRATAPELFDGSIDEALEIVEERPHLARRAAGGGR